MSKVGLKFRALEGGKWFEENTVVTCVIDDGTDTKQYRGYLGPIGHVTVDLWVHDSELEEINR